MLPVLAFALVCLTMLADARLGRSERGSCHLAAFSSSRFSITTVLV